MKLASRSGGGTGRLAMAWLLLLACAAPAFADPPATCPPPLGYIARVLRREAIIARARQKPPVVKDIEGGRATRKAPPSQTDAAKGALRGGTLAGTATGEVEIPREFNPANSPYEAARHPPRVEDPGRYELKISSRTINRFETLPTTSAELPRSPLVFTEGDPAQRLAAQLKYTRQTLERNATYSGEGSSFVVSYVHDDAPPGLSKTDRLDWARKHARYALKILKANALQGDIHMAYKVVHRMLVERRYFDTLSRACTFNGKRLIRPVEILSKAHNHAAGIVKVEALTGPQLSKVQEAVLAFHNHGGGGGEGKMSYAEARASLQRWFPNEEPDAMAALARSVDQAQAQINAVNRFYGDVHNHAIKFQDKNGLLQLYNKMPDGRIIAVGFDYANGDNPHWNVEEQMWVAGE